MKKTIISTVLVAVLAFQPLAALADAAVGDSIVTIGDNLNAQQREEVLRYFNAPQGVQEIRVTIDEERYYLGNSVPAAQIGNSTNSCAMVTYTSKGSGIHVTTNNINYVTPSAYESALLTAGVTDADVKVTAPFEVSGTGALTGIIKAYEVSSGAQISDDVKKAATQELVTNANLSKSLGEDQSTAVINDIKKRIATEKPQTANDIKAIVDKILADYNIQLTDQQYKQLLDTVNQLASLNIDWNALSDNLNKWAHQANDYLNTEEGQNFLSKLGSWFESFIGWFAGLVSGSSDQAPAEETNNGGQ
ncbi:DUF1002 domain-containing protein [Peptococcus simiae]|uniref:DUF1002 domain-containing protein n=1 Tax=Peptococcus simiae TaxID=1643805 RepID=UPI00397EDB6A